jgi:phosphopantetheine adenylyltransferase
MAKSISFSFGRFNPPTIGHEKLMDQTRRANRNYRIYASQSQDAKKNPLNFRSKVSIMKAMFPIHARSISTDKVKTAIDVMVNLYKENYTDVVMMVMKEMPVRIKSFLHQHQ